MAVYVDSAFIPYRRMLMSHLVADTRFELLAMATKIDVDHKWLQLVGTYKEHFDICADRRRLAIELGAIQVTRRELAKILKSKKRATMHAISGAVSGR